ncbi:transcriptional regulator [Cellulomonas chitinilytica]|uniref:Transcriptional regulator n=1 Tax=Cellulomonas chitinilytica TaxID=398759 RepID=A0A919P2U7_9CELL|nr:metalloregulator ArsR/SmtB family transcription factor [Cellulomonas chitinilytica]GIG22391.1 transcriptional regulator [Cellulomonas chitinilytica]
MPVATQEDVLSLTFGALADPTRRAILARLSQSDASVSELAALFPSITLQAVSKHLKVLERAALVTRGQHARERPAHLRAEPIAEATAWLAHYRVFYEDSLDRLGEHLARMQATPPDTPSEPERP